MMTRCSPANFLGWVIRSDTLKARQVLDGDGQALRHGLTARWLFARLYTNSARPSRSDWLPYNAVPAVQVGSGRSQERTPTRPERSADGTPVAYFSAGRRRPYPE